MRTQQQRRNPERGGILVVSLISLIALLGIGVVTMLSVRSDTAAGGTNRFQQVALYAAESGVASGMDFLRDNCDPNTMFSALVEPGNVSPLSPAEIIGNNIKPGETSAALGPESNAWFEVSIYNNVDDPGLASGEDTDGIVTLRAVGHGPASTRTTLELQVRSNECVAKFCATEYAQRGVNARNDYVGACAQAITLAAMRTMTP